MISQDKAWLKEPEKMGPVNKAHVDGTGRFRLADVQFMDIYTGRVIAKEEATARLDSIPNSPNSKLRPPYHYRPPFVEAYRKKHEANGTRPEKWPFLVELKQGMMTNPITGLVEPRRFVKSYRKNYPLIYKDRDAQETVTRGSGREGGTRAGSRIPPSRGSACSQSSAAAAALRCLHTCFQSL